MKRSDFDALLVDQPVAALERVWLSGHFAYHRDAESFSRATRITLPKRLDPEDFTPLATATWHGIKSAYSPPLAGSITVCPVRKTEAAGGRALLLEHALPDLLAWIRAIDQGPETGRTEVRRIAVVRSRGVAVQTPD